MRVKTFISILILSALVQACGNHSLSVNLNVPAAASSSLTPTPVTLPALTAQDEVPAQSALHMATSAPWVHLNSMDGE
ncbi:hypothetical protein EBR78_04510 [bacterium]|nr:hypothetical protein [bacterium]